MPLVNSQIVHQNWVAETSAALDRTKPSLATIVRRTFTKAAGGGDTETLQTVATLVPCRIRVAGKRATEKDVADRPADQSRWTVTMPRGTDIVPFDRILVDGRTFDVRSVGDESYEPEQSALCVEVVSP